jgi:hypothetical protein
MMQHYTTDTLCTTRPLSTPVPVPLPHVCPTCGRPRFCLRTSAALDALLLAREALAEAQALLEEGVLP